MKLAVRTLLTLTLLLGLALGSAQDLREQVSTYTLDNGMRVIMVEQDAAPVISFNLMFDVGGIDEPDGLGGIAHMVEHMAFKGTQTIGTDTPDLEEQALEKVEVLALALEWVRNNGTEEEVAETQAAFLEAREEAKAFASPNALDLLFDANGGVGLNASTGYDRTSYVISMPSNRLELYARVYADILRDTVFRSFYEERDVVREERRQRSEDDPQGVLFEEFLSEAYQVHPYGRPLIGAANELESYLATEAEAFFERYYDPNRAVLVLVGDVEPERDIEILERYFGILEQAPDARPAIPEEPDQTQERRTTVEFDAEPQLAVGYHKPTYPERDAYVLDVIDAVLSAGRTSRLFERMVVEDQVALDVFTTSAFPGTRDPNLFVFGGSPRFPNTNEDMERVFYEEVERLKNESVTERELEKVKNQVRANFIRSLGSSSGLASQLAFYELFLGGWEDLLEYEEIINSVTAEEVQEVAQRIFTEDNRTVALLESTNPQGSAPEDSENAEPITDDTTGSTTEESNP